MWRRGGAWCARGEGGGLWAGWRARARGGGVAVCSAASATVRLTGEEGRPGLAKVGRGARGARGAGGHGQRRGPHPARRGRIPPSIIHGGESWWRRGERHAVPSRPNRTGTGPAGWIPGGRAGLGTEAPGPGSLVVVGRRGGDRAGSWAAAGEGGAWKGRAGSGANPERPPGAGRGLPRAEGVGGLLPARGTTGAPLERGGGRACIARCRSMSIHGRAAWDYIPNPPRRSPFLGGAEGGGAGNCCVHPPMRGGGRRWELRPAWP